MFGIGQRNTGKSGKLQNIMTILSIIGFLKFDVWDRIPDKQKKELINAVVGASKRVRSKVFQAISGNSYDKIIDDNNSKDDKSEY